MSSPTLERSLPLTRDQRSCSEFAMTCLLLESSDVALGDVALRASAQGPTSSEFPTPDIAPPFGTRRHVYISGRRSGYTPRGQHILEGMVEARIKSFMSKSAISKTALCEKTALC